MGFWASAEDVDPGVLPDKLPAGTGDPAFADARDKYAQAFNEVSAWGPGVKAQSVTPSHITRNDMEARAFQDANVARLQSIAAGGPGGVAVPTAQKNLASAGKMNNAYVASRPTTNAAASMRLAGNTNSAQQAGSASRIAMLGAQEQLAAYAALNPALASQRSQDFGVANEQAKLKAQANLANAGFAQNSGLANMDAYNKQKGLERNAYGAMVGNDRAMWDSRMAELRAIHGEQDWDRDLAMNRQARQDMQTAGYLDSFSKGMNQFGNAAAADGAKYEKDPDGYYKASDARVKHKVKDAETALQELFSAAFGGE